MCVYISIIVQRRRGRGRGREGESGRTVSIKWSLVEELREREFKAVSGTLSKLLDNTH